MGEKKTLEVQIGLGVQIKLSICCYIGLDKISIPSSVIIAVRWVDTHAFTTFLTVCKPGTKFIHIHIFKNKLNSDG